MKIVSVTGLALFQVHKNYNQEYVLQMEVL